MTEIDLIQRAKSYIDKLANGINPITNQEVSENDCINNIKVSRCLFFVSDMLRQIMENGGVGASKKVPFQISEEQLRKYVISETPISLSEIARRISALVESPSMKKLTFNDLAAYLENSGYLESVTLEDGKITRRPTENGFALGIVLEERIGKNGSYYVSGYNANAQKYIIDNFKPILEFRRKDKEAEKG